MASPRINLRKGSTALNWMGKKCAGVVKTATFDAGQFIVEARLARLRGSRRSHVHDYREEGIRKARGGGTALFLRELSIKNLPNWAITF